VAAKPLPALSACTQSEDVHYSASERRNLQLDFMEVTIDRELKYKYLKWWAPPIFEFDAHSSRACCTTCVARRQQQPGMPVSCVLCWRQACSIGVVGRIADSAATHAMRLNRHGCCRVAAALLVFAVLRSAPSSA